MQRKGEVGERRKGAFRPMASDGVSSSSRRNGGGGRQDQFAASSVPNRKDDKDGVSPKCFCGKNTIIFMSKTSSNPNRLFLGCPFFKHIARLGMTDTRYLGEKEIGDVEEHHEKQDMKNRITFLEKNIVALEMKKNPIGGAGGLKIFCFGLNFDGFGRLVSLTMDGAFPEGLNGRLEVGAGGLA
ncbi:hypothetical protein Ahy_B01g052946 [Arachis hypogaea]|uniref:Uncharacterized protein n=1 Tax=Arachis hypogaea TaxID=3818 RepID=A0A445AQQ5_ARAHY|nr:hypothetical protein Ahy_B01g052946 [Arachis hypogaea]